MSGPLLDGRDATALLAQALRRRAGYVPGFAPGDGGPGSALLSLAAGHTAGLTRRLDEAPAKRGLALLDLLGLDLVPAQSARTPVVFEPAGGLASVTAPAGTRLGATVPGREEPVIFETEASIAVAAARLVEIASVVPGRDAYARHAAGLASGTPVTLFEQLTPFAHELYLGHDLLFAFCGRSTVEVDLRLGQVADASLELSGAWWDGKAWQPFAAFGDGDDASSDATRGLTAGGTIRLFSPCAESELLEVQGRRSHWVRIEVGRPLAGGERAALPEVERILVRSVVERRPVVMHVTDGVAPAGQARVRMWSPDGAAIARPVTVRRVGDAGPGQVVTSVSNPAGAALPLAAGGRYRLAVGATPLEQDFLDPIRPAPTSTLVDLVLQRGLVPEKVLADGRDADPTRAFQPLGPSPAPGTAVHIACEAVFAKPGAQVVLTFGRSRTAQEEADAKAATYELQIQASQALVKQVTDELEKIAVALDALRAASGALGRPLAELVATGRSTIGWYADVKSALALTLTTLSSATGLVDQLIGLAFGGIAAELQAANAAIALSKALERLGAVGQLAGRRQVLEGVLGSNNLAIIHAARQMLQGEISAMASNAANFLPGTIPSFLATRPEDFIADVRVRIQVATATVQKAATDIRSQITKLKSFNPAVIAAGVDTNGVLPPNLADPAIAWEYWNGRRWATLVAPQSAVNAANLRAPGDLRFTVPQGWEPIEVAGDARRWLRGRLASGSFARMRLLAWTDEQSHLPNFLPVVEPRPPSIDGVEVFFRHETASQPPQRAFSYNDSAWRDHGGALDWPGPGFVPFLPCSDDAPTLYLGFDAPPPTEQIGIWLDIVPLAEAEPLPVRFEAWDGARFRPVAVRDGTRGLTVSGVVLLVWPQGEEDTTAQLAVHASGSEVRLSEPAGALRYASGDVLWIADERGGELVGVESVEDQTLRTVAALSRAYAGALLRPAPPARFGEPRSWLRLRFDDEADPPSITLAAVLANATTAINVTTIDDEVLGGSDATPGQILFLRRAPVLPGATIEVRELQGARAAVDAAMLADELAAAGRSGDLRTVTDPSTGRVTAAWVRWRVRDTLAFSGPRDRDCVIDRVRGRVLFGDDHVGAIPPAGIDNVRASYVAGGDVDGNVGTGAVDIVMSGVLAGSVRNVAPACGGAAGETLERITRRGPAVLRHRRQALTEADFEALALEASGAVARVRALGATDAAGRPYPGTVRVVVVPYGPGGAPAPAPELIRQVSELLSARAALTLAGRVVVTGPRYQEIAVDIAVAPYRPDDAAAVREAVRAQAAAFLHPLSGGPDGDGFAFGASLATSDLSRRVREVPGVDAVLRAGFVVDGVPHGDLLQLADDRLPQAGTIVVSVEQAG